MKAARIIFLFFISLCEANAVCAQVAEKNLKVIMQFNEAPRTHNLHVACDGKNYFTINGGVADSGQICKYTLQGKFIAAYPVKIDGRSFSYNAADGHFYASTYGGDVVRFDDIEKGKYTTLFTKTMQDAQCTFALSPDGKSFYDFTDGKLLIHDLDNGKVIKTITGFKYGPETHAGSNAIAADAKYLYTWDSYSGILWQYDMNGDLQSIFHIPQGKFGHSLSVTNGYVFTADDGDYSTGTWYQYRLPKETGIPTFVETNVTPLANEYLVSGTIDSVEVVNSAGKVVLRMDSTDAVLKNSFRYFLLYLNDLPKGNYQIDVYDINAGITSRDIKIEKDE